MALTLEDPGVDLAGVGVVERHLAAGGPAQGDLLVEREGPAPHARAARPPGAAGGSGGSGRGRRGGPCPAWPWGSAGDLRRRGAR